MTILASPTTAQKRTALAYLAALTGCADTACTWQVFDDGEDKDWRKSRIYHGTLREVGGLLVSRNVTERCGIFVTVNATDLLGRKVANVRAVRALFCDFDGSEPTSWHLPPSIVVRSAHGPHAYWLVDDCELAAFATAQKRLIARYQSDPKLHDLNRVLRVPGFWHQKTAPFMIELEAAPGYHYRTQEVMGGLPELPAPVARPQWRLPANALPGSGKAQWRSIDPVRAFTDAGLYGRDLGGGKHSVACPWTANHTNQDWRGLSGATVIWERGTSGLPVFYCAHASCSGRYLAAALAELNGWQGFASQKGGIS